MKGKQQEILIPFVGQNFVYRSIDFQAEEMQKQSRRMIEKMMAKTMADIQKEYKNVIKDAGIKQKKSKAPEDYSIQAKFYLEQYEYNYKNATAAFKKDLKQEIQTHINNKHLKIYFKKKEKKECVIF